MRQFEIFLIRPLWFLTLICIVVSLINALWFLSVACLLGMFYLGVIGSKFHPLQSASELADGPAGTPAAISEMQTLTPNEQQMLISQACTRVGIFIGYACLVITLFILEWHWYTALPVSVFILVLSGAILKVLVERRLTRGSS